MQQERAAVQPHLTPQRSWEFAALADIIADAHRTTEVIRQLQAFVTAGTLNQTWLNINDVIHETLGRCAAMPRCNTCGSRWLWLPISPW
jgi:hypothetical protein